MINAFKLNWALLVILLLSILGIAFRLNIENSAMTRDSLRNLKTKQTTYKTELTIKSDIEYSHYVAKTVARDNAIDMRVLVKGSTGTSATLSGLEVGDVIFVEGYLTNLGEYETYRKHEHIIGVFHITEIIDIRTPGSWLNSTTQTLRDTIERGCSRLPATERGVCEGLLVGKRNHIDRETYSAYKKAQLTHLLVASGANIAFLVGFLMPVLSRLSRNTKSIALILIACFYCAATRFEPSILRACVMVVIPAVSSMRGYRVSKIRIFVVTIISCMLLDPFLMFRVGFWLSLFATGGLYFVSPMLIPLIKSELICNTLAATICVQPILWIAFGFIAPVRWPASVVAVAIAEPLSTAGMVVVCAVSFISSSSLVGQLLIFPIHLGCSALNGSANIGASSQGYWAGWAISGCGAIAYTYIRYRKTSTPRKKQLSNDNQVSILYRR